LSSKGIIPLGEPSFVSIHINGATRSNYLVEENYKGANVFLSRKYGEVEGVSKTKVGRGFNPNKIWDDFLPKL